MDNKTKSNGSGVLKYSNVESVCKNGTTEEVESVLLKAQYALEKTTEEVDLMVLGFDLLDIDYKTLSQNLKALKKVGATEKQIKKSVGVKTQQIKEYNSKTNYQNYLENIIEKLEKAMG